jgi:hypothetical protein
MLVISGYDTTDGMKRRDKDEQNALSMNLSIGGFNLYIFHKRLLKPS